MRVLGSEFAGVNGYAEMFLGIVHIEQDATTLRLTAEERTSGNVNPLGDNSGLPLLDQAEHELLRFELEYMPFSTRRPIIDVDAVVVSDGRAFALFNPTHDSLHTDWHNSGGPPPTVAPLTCVENQIDMFANMTNPPRVLMFKESGEMAGNIGTMRFIQQRVAAEGITGYLYTNSMTPMRQEYFTAAYRNFLQGPYCYALNAFADTANTIPAAIPEDAEYYEQQFPPGDPDPGWGMQRMINFYRSYALTRHEQGAHEDFIPAIQNHSYGFADGFPNGYTTTDIAWSREPTNKELRAEVNLALAYGAHGILYYLLCPVQGSDTLDLSRTGYRAFLNTDYTPRTLDRYQENYYDSVGTFNREYLRVIGDTIYDLRWVAGYSVQQSNTLGELGDYVGYVMSERQDVSVDLSDETYVEVSEFTRIDPPGNPALQYLFVVNKRTREGDHRHITVKLRPNGATQWKVTDVLSGDIWIVKGTEYPDHVSHDNGFTGYYEPGAARLYRVEPITDEQWDDPSACLPGNLYIEPAATLRTDPTDVLSFQANRGLYVDGALYTQGSTFQSCNVEGSWDGIHIRGISGYAELDDAHVLRAGVNSGAWGLVHLYNSQIQNTDVALTNMGGFCVSYNTTSSNVLYHLWCEAASSYVAARLFGDHATGAGINGSTYGDIGILAMDGTNLSVEESHFDNFSHAVMLTQGSFLIGNGNAYPPGAMGNNSFHGVNRGLTVLGNSEVDLGSDPVYPGDNNAKNEIIIDNTATGYHAYADASSTIDAYQNWWEPYPPTVTPTVSWNPAYPVDPVPFIGSEGSSLSKSIATGTTTATPPNTLRDYLRAALRQKNYGQVRHLAGQFLASAQAFSADNRFLRFVHRALRVANAPGALDTLLTVCLSRSDVESKLLASDIASDDTLFIDAVHILNSYSFAGSTTLQRHALMRKAVLYPLAWRGGYQDGLAVLDTLQQLLPNDSILQRFTGLYPALFSGLTPPGNHGIPKKHKWTLMDRAIPEGIEIGQNYPNPFRDVTSFTFKLGKATHVRLTVHDAMGREVAVLTDADYTRGVHSVVLQSTHLPSGLYFSRFMSDDGIIQRKMMLVK